MNKLYTGPCFAWRKAAVFGVLITLSLFGTTNSPAQLVVTNNQTAVQLVSRFVGSGVTVYNQQLNCQSTHNGVFTATNTNLGLTGGVLLSTGPVNSIAGPAQVNFGSNIAQDVNGVPGDPDLNAIIGSPGFDACALSFNFVPNIDTATMLHFQYVFGSDEYPEYACSQFNDVFAFMITGPNFTPNQNIALVPNTNIPVAINSINGPPYNYPIATCNAMGPGSPFTQYYIDNNGGQTIAFDGFTVVMDAQALLQPCDTYHIKLAIQNTGDEAYQSGVFLRENSFVVDTVSFSAAGYIPTNGGYLVEGCTPTDITFTRDSALPQRRKICLEIDGTATNGTDYPFLADSIVIQPFETSATMTVTPLLDGLTEPVETVIIKRINCCTHAAVDSITLHIQDSLQMTLLTPDTFFCAGSSHSTELHVTGDTAYHYSWTPADGVADSTDTLTMTSPPPTQTTTYTVTASYPGCPSVSRSTTVTIDPLPMVNVRKDTAICAYDNILLSAMVDPPNGTYTYTWSPPGNLSDPTVLQPTFHTDTLGTYKYVLTVATPHNCLGSDSVKIKTLRVPTVDISEDSVAFCTHNRYHMHVTMFPNNITNFNWTPATYLNNPNVKEPVYYSDDVNLTHYVLTVTTSDNCKASDTIDIQTYTVPIAHILTDDTIVCLKDSMQLMLDIIPADSAGTYTYNWMPTRGVSDPTAMQPMFLLQTTEWIPLHVDVTTPMGCKASDDAVIKTSAPVHITATKNTIIPYGNSIHLNADGAYYYYWTPTLYLDNANIKDPIATPNEPTIYTVYAMADDGICRDTATVFVDIDYNMTEFIPSAFTPNGDGKNDVFKAFNMKFQRLLEFRVYNRWGAKVFETTDQTQGWDGNYNGQACDAGVYNYVIRVARPDGTQKLYTGDVTLLR
ncbi:MAG: choice-of-anchor L domain-containing protein [Bacteroidetes bacterium]|nr:choice-of-anchor L domain-containing protein [Bacteroidota bacterium]